MSSGPGGGTFLFILDYCNKMWLSLRLCLGICMPQTPQSCRERDALTQLWNSIANTSRNSVPGTCMVENIKFAALLMQLPRKEKPAACAMETSHHPWGPRACQTPSDHAATSAACARQEGSGAGKAQCSEGRAAPGGSRSGWSSAAAPRNPTARSHMEKDFTKPLTS